MVDHTARSQLITCFFFKIKIQICFKILVNLQYNKAHKPMYITA